MTCHAARITLNRTELFISARAIEAGRLEAHRIHIRLGGPEAPCFVLDRLDQFRSKTLAAKPLLQPEKLDEQHSGPDLADDTANDRILFAQRNGKPLVFLPAHF